MAINNEHVWLYQEAFNFLRLRLPKHADALIIGFQDVVEGAARKMYLFENVTALFESWEFHPLSLDLHDSRADLKVDLNKDITFKNSFDLVFDIGTIEHVADSQRCFSNYLQALKLGGYLFLLTPVKGYFDHGLHTFSPEYVLESLKQNGCEIARRWFLAPEWEGGRSLVSPDDAHNVLMTVIAQRTQDNPIRPIQQRRWEN